MNQFEVLRHDLLGMVEELRSTLHDIGDQDLPPANVVSNARDRLHTISALTEQAAGPTLMPAAAVSQDEVDHLFS